MTSSTRPAQTVAATRSHPRPTVLVIGDERFARRLGEHLPDSRVRHIQAPDETDGFGVDLILIADAYPLSTLADVLVHPSLSRLPVVLVAPGRDIDRRGWGAGPVHVVVDGEDPLTSAAEYIRERFRSEPLDDHLLVRSVPTAGRSVRSDPLSASGDAPLATTGTPAGRHDRGDDR